MDFITPFHDARQRAIWMWIDFLGVKTDETITCQDLKISVFAYTIYQDSYKDLNVTLVEVFPEDVAPNTLLVLDDMMLDCDKNFAKYFTKMRHVNISTVFIVQNLYCCLMLVSIFTQRKILIPRQLLRKE